MATTNYLEQEREKMSRGANKNYWSTSRPQLSLDKKAVLSQR